MADIVVEFLTFASAAMTIARMKRLKTVLVAVAAAACGAWFTAAAIPLSGQSQGAYRAPRGADGHPDLNGIWQAANEANWDIEPHMARAALQLRPGPYGPVPAASVLALGAVGSVPPGMGIVEGGEIPYKPEARAKKKENEDHWV